MKDKFFYLIFFSLILAFFRLIPHPPNFTPILATAIVAPLLIKDRLVGVALPISAMFLSDVIIGFHPYQFVIYLTILSIGFFAPMKKNYIALGSTAVLASCWFFITTNFAVWIIWEYYPKNFQGLITCYTLAIPFFKNTLISTILFTALLTISVKYLELLNNNTNYFIFKFINKKFNF